MQESELIPYAATNLLGEKLLVLAPHPDDEVIGCGGLIRRHVESRRQLRIVILSDGAAATAAEDVRTAREAEAVAGLAHLGAPAPQFLRLPDRQLAAARKEIVATLSAIITEFGPDLIAVPSPAEVHPDHRATCEALVETLQSDTTLTGRLELCQIAFYEVSQPIRPNVLVDITDVATLKFEAVRKHASQLILRNYADYVEGLNAYRSMTLPAPSRFAEAFYLLPAAEIRKRSLAALQAEVSGAPAITTAEVLPITVVVRTRNRPQLLREALASIEQTGYPAEVVVVNDAGQSPRELVPSAMKLLDLTQQAGRSEAMNEGVRAATRSFIAFLDDDDLYCPEHLATLSRAASASPHAGWYTDAVSAFYEMGEDGRWHSRDRLRLYARDFDRELLFFDNYIPLPTLLVRKDDFLSVGGFDSSFDLFEDWDFLLRLTRLGSLLRIPSVTCEVRHFSGGDSILLNTDEERFHRARMQIWSRHAPENPAEVFARVYEKEKRRTVRLFSETVETRGKAAHQSLDIVRLEREKQQLIGELAELHGKHLEQGQLLGMTEQRVIELTGELEGTRFNLKASRDEARRLGEHRDELVTVMEQKDELLRALYREIDRLNGILGQMKQAKAWKLHELVESVRRRK